MSVRQGEPSDRVGPCTLVVPSAWMSWHRVTLAPAILRKRHAETYLRGVVEERLLQDGPELAMAVEPMASGRDCSTDPRDVWVCVVDGSLLRRCMEQLEGLGLLVERAIPEAAPAQETTCQVRDLDGLPTLLSSGPFGVLSLPLTAGLVCARDFVQGINGDAGASRWLHEPALSREAQELNEDSQPIATAELWRLSASSGWDLLQFSLQGGRASAVHKILKGLREGAPWRAVVALALVNTLGLGALVVHTSQEVSAVRKETQAIAAAALGPSTPVLDPVAQLRRLHGASGSPHVAEAIQAWGERTRVAPASIHLSGDRLVIEVSPEHVVQARKSLADWRLVSMQGKRLEYQAEGVKP